MQDFEPTIPLSGNASLSAELTPLLTHIAAVIQQSRQQVQLAVNSAMVQCYWHIGRLIVEHEQQGQARAAYGKQQLQVLSEQLTTEFGKGFDARNLRNMRAFFLAYPNWNAVRTELSWTHYRLLLRVDNLNARSWYQQECQSPGAANRQILLRTPAVQSRQSSGSGRSGTKNKRGVVCTKS
jgi:predicted nuclease of restriction endonuclease-like (RecB) superfamily